MRMGCLPYERRARELLLEALALYEAHDPRGGTAVEDFADDALNELFDRLAAAEGEAVARATFDGLIRTFADERLSIAWRAPRRPRRGPP
jgi:hypothetical protein